MTDRLVETKATTKALTPSVISALGNGWSEMKRHFLVFFLAVLVAETFLAPTNLNWGNGTYNSNPLVDLVMTAYLLLLYPIINYGSDLIFLRGVRGDKVEVKSIFDGFRNYANIVLSSLLVLGLVGIGVIVFVIPGIYVACRLIFVSYLVMDEGLDPITAVEASWRVTRGHVWKIFRLGVVSIFLVLFGLLLLFVGVFPALMWVKAAFASLYLALTTGATTPSNDME